MPAKFNLLVAASIPALAIVPLLACGGDSKAKTDSGIIVHDSPGSGGSNVTCYFGSNESPANYLRSRARYTAMGSGSPASIWNKIDSIYVYAQGPGSGADHQAKALRVAIFGGCGANGQTCGSAGYASPTWPTVLGPKQNIDLGATVGSGSNATPLHPDIFVELIGDVGSDNFFQQYYLAVAGTVNIGSAAEGSGKPFSGDVHNLDLLHIDLGTTITQDPDGCETLVGSASFSATTSFDGKLPIVVEQATDRDYEIMNFLRHRTM